MSILTTRHIAFAHQAAHAAFAILVISSPVASQEPRGLSDQTVPRELAEALLSGLAGRTPPVITVGALPAGLAGKLFVPSGARVLGGTTSSLPQNVGPQPGTSSSAVIIT